MINTLVSADCLSCLFHRDFSCERIPEPFRMQKDVSFHVTYSAYINYIISLPAKSYIKLSAPVDKLKELAITASNELISYYLQDVAFAIAKEVFYAELYSAEASKILPTSYDGNDVKANSLLTAYNHFASYDAVLRSQLSNAGFMFTKNISSLNDKLFKVAVSLYGYAVSNKWGKEVNLVYDLN